jgi:regulator of sigma E protease
MFSTIGQKYISTDAIQKNGLSFGEVGKSVGFKNGDKIIAVDGKLQPKFNWLIIDVLLSDNIELSRNGQIVNLVLTDEQKGAIISTEGRDFVKPRLSKIAVDSVDIKSEAFKSGLKKGDVLLALNNVKFKYFDELSDALKNKAKDSVKLTVIRDSKEFNLSILVNKEGKLGFIPKFNDKLDFQVNKKHTIATAIPSAIKESWQLFVYNIKQFKLILKPKTGAYKQVQSTRCLGLGIYLEFYCTFFYRIGIYEFITNTRFRWWSRSFYYCRNDYR